MQLKGVNNQESLQRQRSAVVQHVHAQLLLHPSHDSVAWRFSFMLHCPCRKVLSAIFFPPSSESRYGSFSTDIFQCDGCLFLFPFCVGLMATIPILTCWNFQKTQHKLSHFMNMCILSLLFPQCWFQAFAKAQTSSKSTLKGTGRKSSQVFRKLWAGMKVVPLCHPWGHYSI